LDIAFLNKKTSKHISSLFQYKNNYKNIFLHEKIYFDKNLFFEEKISAKLKKQILKIDKM